MDAFGDKLNQLARELLARKIDFDFGDELIMAEHGKVSREFVVGEASYKALLLPDSLPLLSSTVALVEEFLDKGGKVIILGRAPEMVEAEAQPHLRSSYGKKTAFLNVESHRKLFQLLEEILPPRVKITDELGLPIGSILCMEREVAGKAVYFSCQ